MNAGIPQDAYGGNNGAGWKNPSELDCCDDLLFYHMQNPVGQCIRDYTVGIWNVKVDCGMAVLQEVL